MQETEISRKDLFSEKNATILHIFLQDLQQLLGPQSACAKITKNINFSIQGQNTIPFAMNRNGFCMGAERKLLPTSLVPPFGNFVIH